MLMQANCPICGNPTFEESQFCKAHHEAHLRVESAYSEWRLAYSHEMSRTAFLERLLQRSETGEKARHIALFLLGKAEP